MNNKQWTFGIVTSGTKEGNISKIIDSIESQGIPDDCYEIIVVGACTLKRKNLIQFDFDETIKPKAWITKKKNMIAQNAKFDNIVLLHDYIYFKEGWYEGYCNFTEDWDVCMNVILNANGKRFRDWTLWYPGPVDYDDNSRTNEMYISGAYFCIKKDYFLQHPLDEKLIWGESEDVEWSLSLRDTWNYKCNKHSTVHLLKRKGFTW